MRSSPQLVVHRWRLLRRARPLLVCQRDRHAPAAPAPIAACRAPRGRRATDFWADNNRLPQIGGTRFCAVNAAAVNFAARRRFRGRGRPASPRGPAVACASRSRPFRRATSAPFFPDEKYSHLSRSYSHLREFSKTPPSRPLVSHPTRMPRCAPRAPAFVPARPLPALPRPPPFFAPPPLRPPGPAPADL